MSNSTEAEVVSELRGVLVCPSAQRDIMNRAAALIESQRATIERVERERDGYLHIVAEIAKSIPLKDTIGATGTVGDMIAYFSSLRARVTALEAEKAGAVADVLAEVKRATTKFPTWPTDPLHALGVLGEEFGELTKETLQLTYEPHKSTVEDFRKEAIQTAAMALRFVMSLDAYQFTPGVQHAQALAQPSTQENDNGR